MIAALPSRSSIVDRVLVALFALSLMDGAVNVGALAFLIRATGSIANADLLASVFWITMTILEVPTGYYTDRWGPKYSLLVSLALKGLGFACYFAGAHAVPLLACGAILCGVGYTFGTGVFSAQLKLVGREESLDLDLRRFAERSSLYRNVGSLLGAVVGYAALKWLSLTSIWVVGIALSLVLVGYVLLRWETIRGQAEVRAHRQVLRSLRKLRFHPTLARVLVLNSLMLMLSLALVDNWPVVFVPRLEHSPELLAGGVVMFWGVRAAAAWLWPRLSAGRHVPLFPAVFAYGLIMTGTALTHGPVQLAMFVLALMSLTVMTILIAHAILEGLPEDDAGTISSIQSLLENVTGSIGLLALGAYLVHASVAMAWLYCGIAVMLLSVAAVSSLGLAPRPQAPTAAVEPNSIA
jgi:MFS family permease